jgi:hypothetical protein
MKKPQAKQIEYIATETLVPYARNAKKHDKAQVAAIAASIKEFEFNNPVLIDADNGIIAGHGRVLAAQLLKLPEVPCIRLGHLTDTQKRAYMLADNRLAEIGGGWDEELLKLEIADLKEMDEASLALVGWSDAELADILKDWDRGMEQEEGSANGKGEALNLLDFTLETDMEVETGQAWRAGKHIVFCGKVSSDWSQFMPLLEPDMLLLPYGFPFCLLCETKKFLVVNTNNYFCALMLTKAKRAGVEVSLV